MRTVLIKDSLAESGDDQDDDCKKKGKHKDIRYNPSRKPQNTIFFIG